MKLGNSDVDTFFLGDTPADKIMLGSNEVWSKIIPSGEEIFTSDGIFTVPAGVDNVTICMIGGGGSGRGALDTEGTGEKANGGSAGEVVSVQHSVTPGANIDVTVGEGGAGAHQSTGNDGTASIFDTLMASGGIQASHNGNGAERITCYDTAYDGIRLVSGNTEARGGQAGFGKGGNGKMGSNAQVGEAGLLGAGGGGAVRTGGIAGNYTGGNGGNGLVKISWGG